MKRSKNSKESNQIRKKIVYDDFLQHENRTSEAWSNNFPLLFFLILSIFLLYLNDMLWMVKSSRVEEFSISNTKSYLDGLVRIGPRITGYIPNEVSTRDYLSMHLKRIKTEIPPGIEFDIDIQHPTGSFHHFQFLHGFHNVYSNITNIIVRISLASRQDDTAYMNSSVLVNAHFDSFMTSPGASDDGVSVAIMLELARCLSQGVPLAHPIILLFNGAEESHQQAAHGFITQHRWADSIRVVINLEAIGSGGRELVFQCNAAWVARVYGESVPFPFASVLAHELFIGVLSKASATDWATFMKYGKKGMVGTDSAYIENGYVYHTPADNSNLITDATMLHSGVNLLSFIRGLSSAKEMNYDEQQKIAVASKQAVFFDILGIYLITYSGITIYVLHYGFGIFGIIFSLILMTKNKNIPKILLQKLFLLIIPCITGIVIGSIYSLLAPSRWYDSGVLLVLLIFLPPSLLSIELYNIWLYSHNASTNSNNNNEKDCQLDGLFFWSVLLVVGTAFDILTSYLTLCWVLFGSLSIAIQLFLLQLPPHTIYPITKNEQQYIRYKSLVIFTCRGISLFPAIFITIMTMQNILTLVLPLVGKIGTLVSGDIIMGAILGIFTGLLSILPLSGISLLDSYDYISNEIIEKDLEIFRKKITIEKDNSNSDSNDYNNFKTNVKKQTEIKTANIITTTKDIYNNNNDSLPISSTSGASSTSTAKVNTTLLVTMSFTTLMILLVSMTLPSYSTRHPKRLWIQHIHRNTSAIGGVVDNGVWINGFDGRGLYPLMDLGINNLDGRYSSVLRGSSSSSKGDNRNNNNKGVVVNKSHQNKIAGCNCHDHIGNCYLFWPWVFPVAEVMRHSFYIPAENPILDAENSFSLTTNMIQISNVIDNDDTACNTGNRRGVLITITGPPHMVLVIKDPTSPVRVMKWAIIQNNKLNNIDSLRDEIMISSTNKSKINSNSNRNNHLVWETVPPVRFDGVHIINFGFGLCPNNFCTQNIAIQICGSEQIEVSAYGHYMGIQHTKDLDSLDSELPAWSRGAEWTHFVSALHAARV